MSRDQLEDGTDCGSAVESNLTALQEEVAQLFEDSRGEVYRYMLTIGLYPQQAQEAVQEAFLRLYTALRGGEEIQNRRAWVFRVAHNVGIRAHDRESRDRMFDEDLEERLADPNSNPELTAVDRERNVRFHQAIQELSVQQRRCLYLRVEGLRYPEIGLILGINSKTVGEFLRRAVTRLRKVCDE